MRFAFKVWFYLSKTYWRYDWKRVGIIFLRVLGALWLIIEISSHSFEGIGNWTRGNGKLFIGCVVFGLLWALIEGRPSPVRYRLKGKDVWIEIKISSIFDVKGAFIISTNTTFDTSISKGLISPDSLQGQFTERYYDDEEYLNLDIKKSLEGRVPILSLTDGREGNTKLYDIGTVVEVRPKNQLVYLVAIAHMDANGKAQGLYREMIENLGKLWNYIAAEGELEPLVVPVLGTGLARLPTTVTRERMIRDLIDSFIAACSEKKFAENLTIVISPEDYRADYIDLNELENYLRHVCEYTDLKYTTDTGVGKAIP